MPFQMNVASGIMAENLDARRVLVDLVEMYCHQIQVASDHEERQALAPHFDYFNKALGEDHEDEPVFGRVHIRRKLAELSLMIGGVQPYAVEEENDDDETEEVSNMSSKQKDDSIQKSCLEQYDPNDWEEIVKSLSELRNCMIRTDATELIVPTKISGLSVPATSHVPKKTSQRNATPHPVHARKRLFNNRFDSLVLMCRVQQSMSHFRPQLETELRRSEEGRDTARLSPRDLVQFRDFVLEHFDGEATADIQEELLSLLKDKGKVKTNGRNTRAHGLSFIPISQAQSLMQDNMFCLDYFQTAALHTLRKWSNAVLEKIVPTLTKMGYANGSFIPSSNPIEEGEEVDAVEVEVEAHPAKKQQVEEPEPDAFHDAADNEETQLDFLTPQELEDVDTRKPSPKMAKRAKGGLQKEGKENISQQPEVYSKEMKKLLAARDTLKNTVVDPLEESRAIAATIPQNTQGTKRTRAQVESEPSKIEKGSFLVKKATATQIAFENSEDEDDAFMERENGPATLSEVPERSKVKPQLERVVRRTSPNRQERQTGQRKKFSQEEKDAIRLGVERFGVGKWAEIKVYYDVELKDRTSVNIKDCYRNMLKRGDL